jgi:endonuclease/exonuclease/phosphatase family metal-dependent hydrolase
MPRPRAPRPTIAALLLALLLAVAAAQPGGATPVPPPADATAAPTDAPHVLDVLTFNTALLPGIAARTRQGDRAAVMAAHLVGYDVLVLQELFDDRLALPLLDELAAAYPYRTERVGRDGARRMPWRQDGGVVILSRWPIEREAQMTFDGTCSGTDCLADKGVGYAAVRKGDRIYHVFGTHAQSVYGTGVAGVRAAQFALLRAFVDDQGIPADEPVVLAGDFNVDAGRPELASMLEVLRAVRPPTDGAMRFTWDPEGNVWADHRGEWLDYVLYAGDHAAPVAAWNRVVPLRHEGLDLSDHYAVWGRLVMGPR